MDERIEPTHLPSVHEVLVERARATSVTEDESIRVVHFENFCPPPAFGSVPTEGVAVGALHDSESGALAVALGVPVAAVAAVHGLLVDQRESGLVVALEHVNEALPRADAGRVRDSSGSRGGSGRSSGLGHLDADATSALVAAVGAIVASVGGGGRGGGSSGGSRSGRSRWRGGGLGRGRQRGEGTLWKAWVAVQLACSLATALAC